MRPCPTHTGSDSRAGGTWGIPSRAAGWQRLVGEAPLVQERALRREEGQVLPQQWVHWGRLRGHQQTAVPPAGVSTQAPSSGPAPDGLDGLFPQRQSLAQDPSLKPPLPIYTQLK